MNRAIRIERHVLASNASSFDTAWRTFGWTPAIAGEAASRLEEQVPWATTAAASEAPARLAGAAEDVLDPANADRLDYAFLPIDGRLAFSVWGAIGERRSDAGEWRVATDTLLLDAEAFDAIAGNPFALFRELVRRGNAWTALAEPAPLEPVVLECDGAIRAAYEAERLREIERLRDALVGRIGAADLVARLAALYEAIARLRRPPGPRHVAMRDTPNRAAPLLARLAWLSLPFADRIRTSFTTEQRRTQRARATLIVLPREWGDFVPEGALLSNGRSAGDIAPGRGFWAKAVAGNAAGARLHSLERCAAARGWSLLDRDDFAAVRAGAEWSDAWLRDGPSRRLAERLVQNETERESPAGPRLRAVGRVAALAALHDRNAASEADTLTWLLDLARRTGAGAVRALRAAIRSLQTQNDDARRLAGALRCASIARRVVPVAELRRLFDAERAAGETIAAACRGTASAPTSAPAAAPSVAASTAAPRTGRALADPLRAAAGVVLIDDLGTLTPLIRLVHEHAGAPFARAFASDIFLDAAAASDGSDFDDAVMETLLRLLWMQPDSGAALAERALVDYRDTAARLLVRLMTAPAPLTTFLAMRRLLLERVLPGTGLADTSRLQRLRSFSPALAVHLAGGDGARDHA